MKLYLRPDCPFCWKVKIYLSEIGVDVEEVLVELGKTHPEVAALNPNATVPVLINEDLVLYESAIIIEYLADKFPQNSLMSGSPEQKAEIRQLQFYSDSKVGKILFPYIKRVRENTGEEDIDALKTAISPDWQKLQKYLSQQLADKAFFGGAFSAADCALIPRISLALAYGLELDEENGKLTNWLARVMSRPSYLKAKPKGFSIIDEMVKKKNFTI